MDEAELLKFPKYFHAYSWSAKHSLYGYPADHFPDFDWIANLEHRFAWLRSACVPFNTASIYLIREMLQWGGAQNGVLQKFEDQLGEVNLQVLLERVVTNLDDPAKAIEAALQMPGMGLTYASKLLRFLDPVHYGALDSRIRAALDKREPGSLPTIRDSQRSSMINGYVKFCEHLYGLQGRLQLLLVDRPDCKLPRGGGVGWRAADIEMALFRWAESDAE